MKSEYCDHPEYTPVELADFDQDWAELSRRLGSFTRAYESVLGEAGECEVGVRAGLMDFIEDMTSHKMCAELLACAIVKLHAVKVRSGK